MGTRVVTIVKEDKQDRVFWSNSTSFDVLETVKDIASASESNVEVTAKLSSFKSVSDVASRVEGFFADTEYPFGDFEYIVYVNNDRIVSNITIDEYSQICGKSVEELIDLRVA